MPSADEPARIAEMCEWENEPNLARVNDYTWNRQRAGDFIQTATQHALSFFWGSSLADNHYAFPMHPWRWLFGNDK